MKKIIAISLFALCLSYASNAQYFKATFTNEGNKLIFKIKPTADFTTAISYLQVAFRYNTAGAPPFTLGTITPNTTNFPSLNIQKLDDYNDGTRTYKNFVHNTGVIQSKTYLASSEYELFTVTLDGDPSTIDLELASDLISQNYFFGIADGTGTPLDPGAGDQFYGPGFNKVGDVNLLPLTDVPVPVKFIDFTVDKKEGSALLSWSVANESAITDRYEVERSSNGIDFVKVYTIPYSIARGSANTYQQTDAVASTGVVYYRIKQLDKDGKSIYSVVKTLRITAGNLGVTLSPNPVKDFTKLTLELAEKAPVTIKITDASGKEMQTIQMQGNKGTNIKPIDLSTFASGNYMMKVIAGEQNKTISVVKIK